MQDPDRYETFKSVALKDTEEFVPQLISKMNWKSKEKILDYGCGAGSTCVKYFLPMAQRYHSTVDAIEISEDMLNYARAKHSHPLITDSQGNIAAADFPLRREQFDRIFSIYVLQYLKNYKNALLGLYNILKPGGELGFTIVTTDEFPTILEAIGKSTKWAPYMKGYEEFLPVWYENGSDAEDDFCKALLEVGFTIIDIRTHRRMHSVEAEGFAQFLVSLNPFLKQIPKHLHLELEKDYRKEVPTYFKISIDDKKHFSTNYGALFCLAMKKNN